VPPPATRRAEAELDEARAKHNFPISIIDYVPPAAKAKRIETAKRLLDAGFDPWVTGPDLDEIGVGRVRIGITLNVSATFTRSPISAEVP
jgi:hypothetical protein